jgi:hypothetical protein
MHPLGAARDWRSIGRKCDRRVSYKPSLAGGVKGHNMEEKYLAGKPRPVGGRASVLQKELR